MERLKLKIAVYIILIKDGKILLGRRFNTGWQDGNYGLPSGHLEPEESMMEALLRETREQTGIQLKLEDVQFVHVMHRKSIYIDFFFVSKDWMGDQQLMEKDKCDDMQWFSLDQLPATMVSAHRHALEQIQQKMFYSEHGW